MRVDFYQLSRDSAEAVLPGIAEKTLAAGERLLIVSAQDAQRGRISQALWTQKPESFLAHGQTGGAHDARQPILIAGDAQADNAARYIALADGQWREAEGAERVFLLFDDATIVGARRAWSMLGKREGVERRYWVREGGGWREGP